ncbi:MAG: RNA 2',3'-cyclic phosphodiesterase [Gemmatirosa sp.]|nr:RNA 2',3'-cyclic phosphodiesterase [Gemmatirosa sp.]
MRAFIALTPEGDVRAALWGAAGVLRAALGDAVAWVPEPALHVTLKFLGEVGEIDVDRIAAALRARISSPEPLVLRLAGLGAFPSLRRPRVLWIGVAPNPGLAALYQEIERAAVAVGLPADDRPFHAHLTLGRVRDRGRKDDVSLAELATELEFRADAAIRAVDVNESTLGRDGPRYCVVAAIPLVRGAREV